MTKYISTRIYSFDARNRLMDCIQTRTQRPIQVKSTCIYTKPEEWMYSENSPGM